MFEAMAMFTPALAVALISEPGRSTAIAVWLFLVARVLYVPGYLFGLLYVRPTCWSVGLVAIGLLLYSGI